MRAGLSPSERLARNTKALDKRAVKITGLKVTPSPVHERTVEVLTELMTLGNNLSGSNTPAYLRAMMRTLTKSKPFILDGIADVPPHLIQEWMRNLQQRIQPILDIEVETSSDGTHEQDGAGTEADPAGPDLIKAT